ncbi:MAG: FAD-dependent oxidoreductase, partial [Clostridia bacterium]|nr:FAD-dependent oxidoreductase [Clostridia bacterium]
IEISKKVNVIGHYDVVVCGGGCAGFTAAISAARSGARTALIERYGFIGGTATAGYVVPISGFFFKGKRVVGGIAWELVEELEKRGAALVEYPKGHVSYNPEYYKQIAEQMLVSAGVDLYTNSYISSCRVADGRVTHVIFESKNGSEALSADCFIDATGDGDLLSFRDANFSVALRVRFSLFPSAL